MKNTAKKLVLLVLLVVCAINADAKAKKQAAAKSGLGTDHSFSAADVRGRYQYPAGGTVTVENEKDLIDLLGVRKHFKDRLTVETTRN